MKQLTEYLNRENHYRSFGNRKPLSLSNSQDREELARLIDCSLSPENVHMDGECSPSEADERYRYYSRVARQLLKLDPQLEIGELY